MDENDPIEKRIINFLYATQPFATTEKLHIIVKRSGLIRTTKQQVVQRISYLEKKGILQEHHGLNNKKAWMLGTEKREELDNNGHG